MVVERGEEFLPNLALQVARRLGPVHGRIDGGLDHAPEHARLLQQRYGDGFGFQDARMLHQAKSGAGHWVAVDDLHAARFLSCYQFEDFLDILGGVVAQSLRALRLGSR